MFKLAKNLLSFFDFDGLGICLKNRSKKIIFQNVLCKQICGNKMRQLCGNCAFPSPKQRSLLEPRSSTSSTRNPNRYISNQLCDVHQFIEKKNKELILFKPIQYNPASYLALFRLNKFTNREIEIGLFIIENKSNAEIQKQLNISKSTLKTHLNHIYQKLPDLKAFRSSKKENT